jgi:hypothetical protein
MRAQEDVLRLLGRYDGYVRYVLYDSVVGRRKESIGTMSMDDLLQLIQQVSHTLFTSRSLSRAASAPTATNASPALRTGDNTVPRNHRCVRFSSDVAIGHVHLTRSWNEAARTSLQLLRTLTIYPASILVATLSLPAYPQQPIIYPARGQSPEQQQKDQGECMAWAQQTTGVNPTAVAQSLAADQPSTSRGLMEDERVQGAVVGALGGAGIGAIAGNKAGKGARDRCHRRHAGRRGESRAQSRRGASSDTRRSPAGPAITRRV